MTRLGQSYAVDHAARMAKLFRTRVQQRHVATVGVYDALGALLLERLEFPAIYLSGYSVAVGQFGFPDIGLVTATETVETARRVCRAAPLTPVICDADDGYGNHANTLRTVEGLVAAGVAGFHLEDQVAPKRCGHLAGKQVISTADMQAKLRAAAGVKAAGCDFYLIARTDALGVEGGSLADAVQRGTSYAAIDGVDCIWCEFTRPNNVDEAGEFARRIHAEYPDVHLAYNYSSSFRWDLDRDGKPLAPGDILSFDQLAKLGYRFIFITLGMLHAAAESMWDFARQLREQGQHAQVALNQRLVGHPTESHHLLGEFPYYAELEKQIGGQRRRGAGFGGSDKQTTYV
jgi:isocitrate lyase